MLTRQSGGGWRKTFGVKGFMTVLKILLISVCCYAAGAAWLCAVQGGLRDIVMAPLFVVFLWFYLPPIALLVWLMWVLHRHIPVSALWRGSFVIAGAVLGCGVIETLARMVSPTLNPEEIVAGLVGAAIAGATANALVTFLQGRPAEPGAAPNRGPPKPSGNSSITARPPSVS